MSARTQIFNGVELGFPDAYTALNLDSLLTPSAGGIGIVALVGEADGGAPGITVFAGGTSPDVVKQKLKSGPGANMVRLALRSGSDPLVQSGASTVLFVKTNNSTRSTSSVNAKGTLTTKQYGAATANYQWFSVLTGGKKFVTVRENSGKPKSIVETTPALGDVGYFSLYYGGTGTAATFTFHYVGGLLKLQTTLTGQTNGEVALNIDCSGLNVSQLVQLINANTGYVATVLNVKDQVLVSDLDLQVGATNILLVANIFKFVASLSELAAWATSQSQLVTFVRAAGDAGDFLTAPFPTSGIGTFAGGTRGTSANSDVQTAISSLLGMRVNILVPLFSADNQDGSTITLASVNSQVKDHVETRSSLLGRSECQAYVSIAGNKDAFKAEASRLNSVYMAVTSQKVNDLDIDGNVVLHPEYAFAVVCAQTQSGSPVGTPLESRSIPSSGITQDVSWSPVTDTVELLKAGCLVAVVEEETNVIVIKGGYTCWLADDNIGRVFIETVESLAVFNFNHRKFMRQRFGGRSAFTDGDVLKAIAQSHAAERDETKSIKNYDEKQTKLFSSTGGRLEYQQAVVPWQGIRFILATTIAIASVA